MRNPDRLDNFYSGLYKIHKAYPDLRFNQFVELINSYIEKEKEIDPFYVEDEKYIEYAEELRRENEKLRYD